MRRILELGGIDDDGEVFLVIFVVVEEVKECRSVRGGYAGAGHAPHLNIIRGG